MFKTKQPTDKRKPVSRVVHEILEQARIARTDGPASGLYGRDAQLSGALTKAGTLLARLDGHAPGKKPTLLNAVFGSLAAPLRPRKRSWLFAPAAPMPDAKRIEHVLRATVREGHRLVLDQVPGRSATNGDIACHLPHGAVDPVCEPRS